MDLVAQLADETDAQDAHRNAGELADPRCHVGECRRREIDVAVELFDHRPRLRAGEVDAGVGGGDVGDVDVHLPLRIEPGHLPVDLIDGAGRRRDVVVALVQARGDAVVDDDARLIGHQRIACAADLLLFVRPRIHALDERGGVRPAHVEAAQRRHVDHADAFAHGAHLALDRARGVVLRP